jgi:hypothetical protein
MRLSLLVTFASSGLPQAVSKSIGVVAVVPPFVAPVVIVLAVSPESTNYQICCTLCSCASIHCGTSCTNIDQHPLSYWCSGFAATVLHLHSFVTQQIVCLCKPHTRYLLSMRVVEAHLPQRML